jgi:hypothetical protein
MDSGKFIAIIAFCLIFSGTAFAVPGIPHQFYGYVTINQVPADGATIVAEINDVERASTTSINGNYGLSPSIFYVPDPNSMFSGETIEVFLNGTSVATYVFETGQTTRLDLFLGDAPFCGDGICNLDEDAESCQEDCGTGPVCGDAVCDPEEDCESCEEDCGECVPICGDEVCDGEEDNATCPEDCPPTGPYCGDTVCNSDVGETCSSCPGDCGACSTGGSPIGGGPSSSGGAPKLRVQIDGACIDQTIEVTVSNTVGNPAKNATVKVLKDMKTIAEEKTGDSGVVSFTFSEEGDYTFYVTKNLYAQNTKTITVDDCPAGETGAGEIIDQGETTENLCANVNCDDQNPCTTEFCIAATGHCSYENQLDGTVCSNTGKCIAGVCEEPEQGQEGVAAGPIGLFGLSLGQGAGAGLVIVALIALLAYLYAKNKRKGKK